LKRLNKNVERKPSAIETLVLTRMGLYHPIGRRLEELAPRELLPRRSTLTVATCGLCRMNHPLPHRCLEDAPDVIVSLHRRRGDLEQITTPFVR